MLSAEDLRDYVHLYKNPSDPVFYEVNYHCYGVVPALSNPAYYTSKLTSAVITSLMTGELQAEMSWVLAMLKLQPLKAATHALHGSIGDR